MPDLDAAILKHLKEWIPNLQLVYRFGSSGTEFEHKDSDVDVAFFSSSTLSDEQRWELSNQLASLINQNVDLLDLQNLDVVMQYLIVNEGRCLYQDIPTRQAFFENKVDAMYLRLSETRAEIVEDILKRGKVRDR